MKNVQKNTDAQIFIKYLFFIAKLFNMLVNIITYEIKLMLVFKINGFLTHHYTIETSKL